MAKTSVDWLGYTKTIKRTKYYMVKIGSRRSWITYQSLVKLIQLQQDNKLTPSSAKKIAYWGTQAGQTKKTKIAIENLKTALVDRFDKGDYPLFYLSGAPRSVATQENFFKLIDSMPLWALTKFFNEHSEILKSVFASYEKYSYGRELELEEEGSLKYDKAGNALYGSIQSLYERLLKYAKTV